MGARGPFGGRCRPAPGEKPAWTDAAAFLHRCRTEGRSRRPFDFFSRLLGWTDGQGRSVRARILTRLGSEAEDVLHEFLAQVLAAERAGIADLERLVQDFASLDITVKREMEGARGEVRVMTVHGAKGLEAPIVFLPETTLKRTGARLAAAFPRLTGVSCGRRPRRPTARRAGLRARRASGARSTRPSGCSTSP
ncbi:MAG: 3'-5' exonuclease [Caulobacteraceae bacterium]